MGREKHGVDSGELIQLIKESLFAAWRLAFAATREGQDRDTTMVNNGNDSMIWEYSGID